MNKLTKQLLSLGLSVVTVAGMVSPVLANDGVNVLKAQNSSTQTTKEVQKQLSCIFSRMEKKNRILLMWKYLQMLIFSK